MKEIISPLTLTNKVSFLQKIKTKDIINKYRKYQLDVSKYFIDVKEVSIYQCDKTGYKFYYPCSLAGDSAFYQHFQNFDWYYMPWKWEHEITTSYLKDGMNILEVGCAHGAFLEKINKLFDLGTCVGLELNESSTIKKEKFEIVNKYVQDYAKIHSDQFDLVCSYQVLEHIAEVQSFIEANVACLRKGGKLIISVPNNDSYIKNLDSALNMPPHHMGLWTKSSLSALTQIFPLTILEIHFEKLKEYHIDGYIWSERYSSGNRLVNKIKRKFDVITGNYSIIQTEVLEKCESIMGHTILVVFEKK